MALMTMRQLPRLVLNLSMSDNPRAIYLGALSGIEQMASEQVAYSASKFALRGAIQSLRKAYKDEGVGFTVINPGNVATDEVLSDMENGLFKNQQPIPMTDIFVTIEWLMSLSRSLSDLTPKTHIYGNQMKYFAIFYKY